MKISCACVGLIIDGCIALTHMLKIVSLIPTEVVWGYARPLILLWKFFIFIPFFLYKKNLNRPVETIDCANYLTTTTTDRPTNIHMTKTLARQSGIVSSFELSGPGIESYCCFQTSQYRLIIFLIRIEPWTLE